MDEELKKQIIDEINSVIKSRISSINRNYVQIRDAYKNGYHLPELDPLRHEICLCIFFGLDQAAITLTNHFFEALFKFALINKESELQKAKKESGPPSVASFIKTIESAFDKYNSKDLSNNIDRACTIGLITKEQKKELQRLRDDFRNAYSHSDKEKTFRDGTIPAQAISLEGDQLTAGSVEEADVAKLIFAHGILQVNQANVEAIPYFLYLDKVARQVIKKLFGDLDHIVEG